MLNVNITKTYVAKLTESENALLLLFTQFEGREIGEDYLSERALKTLVTDGGLVVRRHIDTLRQKLRGSGYHIRDVIIEIPDIDKPEKIYCYKEYVYERVQPPDGSAILKRRNDAAENQNQAQIIKEVMSK